MFRYPVPLHRDREPCFSAVQLAAIAYLAHGGFAVKVAGRMVVVLNGGASVVEMQKENYLQLADAISVLQKTAIIFDLHIIELQGIERLHFTANT